MIDASKIVNDIIKKTDLEIQLAAQTMQNFINGPEANDATMAGQYDVAFYLKTARVVVVKKSNSEYSACLEYSKEHVPEGTSEDLASQMRQSFFRSKQFVFG